MGVGVYSRELTKGTEIWRWGLDLSSRDTRQSWPAPAAVFP